MTEGQIAAKRRRAGRKAAQNPQVRDKFCKDMGLPIRGLPGQDKPGAIYNPEAKCCIPGILQKKAHQFSAIARSGK